MRIVKLGPLSLLRENAEAHLWRAGCASAGAVGVRQSSPKRQPRRPPPAKLAVWFPLHSELKVGTLAGALRQAQVTTEEFLSVLQ